MRPLQAATGNRHATRIRGHILRWLRVALAVVAVAVPPMAPGAQTGMEALTGSSKAAGSGLDGTNAPRARLTAPSTLTPDAMAQPDFLPVEEAYPLAVEVEGPQSLRLVWQMPPGYYLYQHAFDFDLTDRKSVV